MAWDTSDPLVGDRVVIYTDNFTDEPATVVAVSTKSDKIKVRADDGEILIGNQWELLS